MFAALEKMSVSKNAGFPPYNISKNEDKYEITMALAGYKKDHLNIKVEDRKLLVETIDKDEDEKSAAELLHQGIARRNFTSTFVLGEYVQVKGAKLEDGLLTIHLELELPDEKKPRQITIK
jgi:molecular chaperone IbpA